MSFYCIKIQIRPQTVIAQANWVIRDPFDQIFSFLINFKFYSYFLKQKLMQQPNQNYRASGQNYQTNPGYSSYSQPQGQPGFNAGLQAGLGTHSAQPRAHTNVSASSGQQRFNIEEQQKKQAAMGIGASLFVLALIFACVNIGFIIPDLIYANEGSECVTSPVDGFSFNLGTWLKVDAYTRIVFTVFLLVAGILSCMSFEVGFCCSLLGIIFWLLYSLFLFAWSIVGAIMFWGKLNPAGKCSGGVQAFMHATLIITFVFACCNALSGGSSGRGLNPNRNVMLGI